MKKEILNVNGMSCSHCERAIYEAVSALSGVSEVIANAKAKTVDVTYDETTLDLDSIIEIIEEEGYDVV